MDDSFSVLFTLSITLSVTNSNLKPESFDKLTRLNRNRLSHAYTEEMKQHFHVPLTTRQLLRVSSCLYLSFAEWGNLLKKHDTEFEEAVNSAESARGWMTDTLGSDNYPGLIRRGRESGIAGRQISEFLQSRPKVQYYPVRPSLPVRVIIRLLLTTFRTIRA